MSSATRFDVHVMRVYSEGTLAGIRIPVIHRNVHADSERDAIARCSGVRRDCVTRRRYCDVVLHIEESPRHAV